jgi:carbamoylphosphate synthase large subunit
LAISRRLTEFDTINVKVLVERDYDMLQTLSDKIKTYRLFERFGYGIIPPYAVSTTTEEFEAAYAKLKNIENRVCLKFASDEGAVSFRVIDDRIEYNLTESVGSKITYSNAVKSLERIQPFPTLIVMPYLSGIEVSVDCLYRQSGEHIIIPRFKSRGRSETIKYDDKIVKICNGFLNHTQLHHPCNIQFKYDSDVPYLLEVNSRMSGGIQLSYAATGINIPNIAVNRLLGNEKSLNYDKSEKVVSFIETPIVVSEYER